MMDEDNDTRLEAKTAEDLLRILKAEAGPAGFQRQLDDNHSVTFLARGPKLLVTFEKIDDTLASSEDGLPLGLDFVEDKNWSLLHFAAAGDSWFRSQAIYEFLDEMVDEMFFDDFDAVTFYGHSMGGYAAAAFSVVAPGARVIAVAPQASLSSDRAEWDDRFKAARRFDFEARYGYAPDMLEGADKVYVIYDPIQQLDAVHASLFRGPNVTHLRARRSRPHTETFLRQLDILHPIVERGAEGSLTEADFYRMLRARRQHSRYLRNLLFDLDDYGNPVRTAFLCTYVLKHMNRPAFRRRLQGVKKTLAERGPLPNWLEPDKPRADEPEADKADGAAAAE